MIFVEKIGDRLAYYHVTLGKGDLERLRAQIAPVLAVKGLNPGYEMSCGVTDQRTARLYLRAVVQEVATSVYGPLRRPARASKARPR